MAEGLKRPGNLAAGLFDVKKEKMDEIHNIYYQTQGMSSGLALD
jgi:hypothetical protein